MKAKLKKMFGLAALGMSLLAVTVPTWAGSANAPQVRIVTNNGAPYATGSLVGARYSADTKQSIQCQAQYTYGSFGIWCYASDSTGKSLECTSADPKHLEAVQGMTDSSYIYFQLGNNNQCGSVAIYNSSSFLK